MLKVSGRFRLDVVANPPVLKPIAVGKDDSRSVGVGRGVRLLLGRHLTLKDGLLNARIVVDRDRYRGLGSVVDSCAVLCASNYCREWARRNGRPRVVAKVIGVQADEPTYIVLTPPRLKGASRARHESTANRIEAGLVPFVVIEPVEVACPTCPGPNVGAVTYGVEPPIDRQ